MSRPTIFIDDPLLRPIRETGRKFWILTAVLLAVVLGSLLLTGRMAP